MTATEARCTRTDLPVTMCAHCRPAAQQPDDDTAVVFGPVFPARYPGRCSLCSGAFDTDERIAAVLDDWNRAEGYACTTCYEAHR